MAVGEEPGAFAVPGIEVVFQFSREDDGRAGPVTRIDVRPVAFSDRDGPAVAGTDIDFSPTDGDRGGARFEDVNAHLCVRGDVDTCHGGFEDHFAPAVFRAVEVEAAGPGLVMGFRRQGHDLGLAAVGQAEVHAVLGFDLHASTFVRPDDVAGQHDGVDGGMTPGIVFDAFDEPAVIGEADAAVVAVVAVLGDGGDAD